MSRSITSYFAVIPKSKTGQSSSTSNNEKNRFSSSEREKEKSVSPKKRHKPTKRKQEVVIIDSDEEDVVAIKQVSEKKRSSNADKTRRDEDVWISRSSRESSEPKKQRSKRLRVESDSEDEITAVEKKSKKPQSSIAEKIVPKKIVAPDDIFGRKPVKRTEAPKPSKQLPEEDADIICDDDFEAVLNQVEKSEISKTTGKINGKDKTEPSKIGSKKKDGKSHKLSNSDESPANTTRKVIRTDQVEKVSEEGKIISEHFQKTKTSGKDKATKNTKANESSKPSSSSSKKTTQGISEMTIEPTPGQNKRKRNEEDEENAAYENMVQKKKHSAVLYQQYLHRGGARNPGSKEIPTGADNCLAGLSFLITGVLESMEREEADELIKQYGGRTLAQVSKKTNYIILGDEPGPSKLKKAKDLGLKMISEDDLLDLIRTRPAGQARNDGKNLSSTKKTPRKTKQRTPEPEPLTATEPDPSPKIERGSEAKLGALDNKPEALSSEKSDTSKANQVLKKSDTPPPEAPSSEKSDTSKANQVLKKSDIPPPQAPLSEKSDTSKANEVLKKSDIPPVVRTPCKVESQVWVEKYKPKTMKQIIGQQGEKSNANKLHNWLKNWQKNQTGNVKRSRPSPWAQNDGSFFKAALLSGPPGVGKTTTVQVVCNALGLDALEFNASDTRSKRLLKEEVSQLLSNTSMKGYFVGGDSKKPDLNHVLVMDEVDGMAGNEDRGGLQELIALIKTTSVPVICICNDRNNPKMRTLANYTYDLKFQKPRIEQIRSAMMSVCFKENIKIATEDLNRLIESTDNDVRQVLNHLSLLAENPSNGETPSSRRINKDLRLGPWDVVQKVFTHEAHKTMSIHDKSDLFFHDYNIASLFVQENYLSVVPKGPKEKLLGTVADAAESLALGDLVENAIRRSGAWSLLPTQACYSSVIPGTLMSGHISRQIMFPSWLGQNSRRGKFDRLLQEITIHTRLATSSSKDAINLDYLKHLRDAIVRPLVNEGAAGATSALEAMNYYNLLREDLDSLAEVALWPGERDPMQALDSKVKAAFTRAFNKNSTLRPYAVTKGAEKKKRAQAANQEDLLDFEEEGSHHGSENEEESASNDPMIKVKKASTASSKNTAEKGAGGSKKKGSNSRGGKSK